MSNETMLARQEAQEDRAAQVAGDVIHSGQAPIVKTTRIDAKAMSPVDIGKLFHASKFFPDVSQAAQAAVKIMAGAELGIKPVAAMTGIHLVKGRVHLGYTVLASLLDQHPAYDYVVEKLTDDECEIHFFKHGKLKGKSTFTKADAKRQATQNLDKFPRNMLLARALSNGVKWFCAGLLGGLPVYIEGEIAEPPEPEVRQGMSESDKLASVLDAREQAPAPTYAEPEPFTASLLENPEEFLDGEE